MRRLLPIALAALALLAAAPAAADLLSKSFQFKGGVILDIGAAVGGGLRLDTVQFQLPEAAGRGPLRFGGQVRADVAVSNTSERSRKVGIAIALFDDRGRLVGVASGGSKLIPIKSERQSTYTLVFDDVNSLAHQAATFQITVEPR